MNADIEKDIKLEQSLHGANITSLSKSNSTVDPIADIEKDRKLEHSLQIASLTSLSRVKE